MAGSLPGWTDLSDTATIAQLTGVDLVKVLVLLIEVAKIPQILKKQCRLFGQRLEDVRDLLEVIMKAKLMQDTSISGPLKRLENAVKKACVPVDICQKGSYFNLFTSYCAIKKCLNEAQEEVDECLKIIPLLVVAILAVLSEQGHRGEAPMAATQTFIFKQQFDEASKDITDKTGYEYSAKKWDHDPTFEVLGCKERESLFNQRMKTSKDKVKAGQIAPIDNFSDWPEERKREIPRRKEHEEQEMERVRLKARRKDAVTSYQALLTERIKYCKASWTKSKPKLEKDPLGRATNSDVDLAEQERLFHEHVNGLYERCVREYQSLLAEVITVDMATKDLEDGKNILTSWSDAKHLLQQHKRYGRMPRRERELCWRSYADDVQRRVKVTGSERNKDKPNVDDSVKKITRSEGKAKS